MNILTIVKSDLKIILRDASLRVIIFVPLLFAVLLRLAPPFYENYFPALIEYRPHILAFFCIITSALMGFILSFILLDERDQNLFPVFRILPFSFKYFLLIRGLLIMFIGFISSILLILSTSFIGHSFTKLLLLSFSCSMVGPSSTFIITSVARNKIEGVTLFKLFNMLLFLPIVGLFVKIPFTYFFGLIPYYWIYNGFLNNTALPDIWVLFLACFLNFLLLFVSFRFYVNKQND